MKTLRVGRHDMAFGCRCYIKHDCTPQGSRSANTTGGKVKFELATYGIKFYVFCQHGHSWLDTLGQTVLDIITRSLLD